MAADPDRYEALRETAREVEKRSPEAQQPPEKPEPDALAQSVSDDHLAQPGEAEPPLECPTRPTVLPHLSPGWTDDPGLEAQAASANRWHNWANATAKEQFLSTEQTEQTAEAELPPDAPPPSPPGQDQTIEREPDEAKPPLTFNWDRDQGLERER